jgi:thiamine pyrophosphate-dependent acetolactate synthase large subunit-like protein
LAPSCSDSANQEEAVSMVVDLFTNHVKPVIIIGPKVRMFRTRDYRRALVRFAEKVGSILLLENTRHSHHVLACLVCKFLK